MLFLFRVLFSFFKYEIYGEKKSRYQINISDSFIGTPFCFKRDNRASKIDLIFELYISGYAKLIILLSIIRLKLN